ALLLNQPTSHRAQTRQPKSRALLVGIDLYLNAPAVKPTRGAEADAIETRSFIKEKYGFSEDDIHTLIGKEATATRIKQEFQNWLIRQTQPGDRVFFLYAGHGSQMPDTNGDETDKLDEVLAPYDVNWRGDGFDNVIVDDELDELIQQLAGRLAVFVFDSCNSGTITRGVPGANSKSNIEGDARYLPSPVEARSLRIGVTTRGGGKPADYTVSDERILTAKSGAETSQPREVQERDLKLVDVKTTGATAGHVVISAAQSNQSAFSMDSGGKQRGALSLVFAEAQHGQPPTVGELRQRITSRIAELQQSGRLRGKQRPEIEATTALEDQPLFAAKQSVPEIAFANPQSKLSVSLHTREKKQTYKLDEDISYEITTNAPGWLYLFVFSREQQASFIFPNSEDRDNYLPAGTHRLPREDAFMVIPPCGKDITIALLSSVDLKLGAKDKMSWQEVFDLLGSKKLAGYVKTRGVGLKKNNPATRPISLDEADWQAASLAIETIVQGTDSRCKSLKQ
ncbi:MAG TPA: caspase family protein, partial [Blastocatellia bacterium]|nr:caspase family protein [Blastocatellia bacterium]